MEEALIDRLTRVLLRDARFAAADGTLIKSRVHDALSTLDDALIGALLDDPEVRMHLFKEVGRAFVLDVQKLKWILESRAFLPNSYTAYCNRIGLVDGSGQSLGSRGEVVLVWPYKDCVLAGGQTIEGESRHEIFYNETLAPQQVRQLLAPKALTGGLRYTAQGATPCTEIEPGDNLIIRGNNLQVLSSLVHAHGLLGEGVKCIYIDPPYNTGNDGFRYNDRFSRSTWLTFMKNRLELARKLLRPDGFIFVQCDDNEQAYLKVLMDEIFGREHFVSTMFWKGRGGRQDSRNMARVHEQILVYQGGPEAQLRPLAVADRGSYPYRDARGAYKLQLARKWGSNSRRADRPNLFYPVEFEGRTYLPMLNATDEGCWRWGPATFAQRIAAGDVCLKDGELYEKVYKQGETKRITPTSWIDDIASGTGSKHLATLLGAGAFDYPKPEELIARFLELATEPGDLVLDFHLGSGTTASAAHKMGRRYIGVEQMDYIRTVTVPRLQRVIEGEAGGISQSVQWQGGGSFVYLELKELGEAYMARIAQASTPDELLAVRNELIASGYVNYLVETDTLMQEGIPTGITLAEYQQLLCTLVEKNQLYVNLSEIDDETHHLSTPDRLLTRSFYRM